MSHLPEEPNIDKLVDAMAKLAAAMQCRPMATEYAREFLDYMLYDREMFGLRGRNGWTHIVKGVITEVELRNLLMAHCATTTAYLNEIDEPGSDTYVTRDLDLAFELGLYGRHAVVVSSDVHDQLT